MQNFVIKDHRLLQEKEEQKALSELLDVKELVTFTVECCSLNTGMSWQIPLLIFENHLVAMW